MIRVLTYALTLRSPVVLGIPGGDPNSVRTLRFVPGGVLRGAVAAAFLRRNRLADPADDPVFRHLFLDGTVRWLHAYPEGRNGQRLLPRPASLRLEKGTTKPVYDLAAPECDDLLRDGDDLRHLIPFGPAFVSMEGDPPLAYHADPEIGLNFHHQRDRAAGRPTEGNIFTYQALQPGERFVGHVLCDREPPAELDELLTSTARLGRSRSVEYGKVTIELTGVWTGASPAGPVTPDQPGSNSAARQAEAAGWSESPWDVDQRTNHVVMTLHSDFVPEDPFAQSGEAALVAALLDAGLPADTAVKSAYSSASLSGGYVAAWHLPAPQIESLAAGAVFILESKKGFDGPSFREVGWSGVGARRAEGSGRVAFGYSGRHATLDPYDLQEERRLRSAKIRASLPDAVPFPNGDGPSALPEDIARDSRELLTRARKSLLTAGLDRNVLPKALDLVTGDRRSEPVSKSVVGRLRSAVRNAGEPSDILGWLDTCEGKKAQQTVDARVLAQGKALGPWIRTLLNADEIWHALRAFELARTVHIGSGDEWPAQPNDEAAETVAVLEDDSLRFRYQRALIDAVLTRVLKHARRD